MRHTWNKNFAESLLLHAAGAAVAGLIFRLCIFRKFDPAKDSEQGTAKKNVEEIAKRLGRPLIDTNPHENVIASDVINPKDIDTTFDSIGGLESIKKELHDLVILPLKRPDLFAHCKLLSPPKGILLYGPPGTGKTLLARAIAKESGAVFINVRISNLTNKWFGESEKLVTAVFSLAHKLQPTIIFLDEIDSFLGNRRSNEHDSVRNIKTEFMSLWDGFATDHAARVTVLAATNRPEELDEAILRRLPRVFEVGMPSCRERAKILESILKDENVDCNIDYDFIATLCEGYTGSDLKEICRQAAYLAIRELLEREKEGHVITDETRPRPLKQSDLEKVLSVGNTSRVAAAAYGNKRVQTAACNALMDSIFFQNDEKQSQKQMLQERCPSEKISKHRASEHFITKLM